MATVQRIEKTQGTAPRTRARGHLALVEWERVEQVPEVDAPKMNAPKMTDPVQKTGADRLFEGGLLLLMAATTLAVIVSLAHL